VPYRAPASKQTKIPACQCHTGHRLQNKQKSRPVSAIQGTGSITNKYFVFTHINTYAHTSVNSKQHSSSRETSSSSAGQNIIRILWKTKVHYSVHNSPPHHEPDKSSRRPSLDFFNIHFTIILQSALGLPSGLFTQVSTQNLYMRPSLPHVSHSSTIPFFFI